MRVVGTGTKRSLMRSLIENLLGEGQLSTTPTRSEIGETLRTPRTCADPWRFDFVSKSRRKGICPQRVVQRLVQYARSDNQYRHARVRLIIVQRSALVAPTRPRICPRSLKRSPVSATGLRSPATTSVAMGMVPCTMSPSFVARHCLLHSSTYQCVRTPGVGVI